jgi:hypothetical protein
LDAASLETLRLREEGSAVRIQAVVRGHRARQRVQWITEDGQSVEEGHRRAFARAAAKARGDPYCRRLEGRSSYAKLRKDIAGILLDALVEVGSNNAEQHADDWAVREVLGDAVAVAARRHAIGMGTDGEGRRNSIEEMRKQQQEMEDRALRRHRLTEGHPESDQGPGNVARYLSSCVQPVLTKSLLAYDMEDPRPGQMSAALKRAIRTPEEEGEPPSMAPGVVQ